MDSEVECVVMTRCENSKEFMVELEGENNNTLKITPYHPVYQTKTFNHSWKFPIDMGEPREIECKDMFTFIIKNRKSVIIEDYIFATFGHNMEGNVIEHDYFGNEKVINDLKCFTTYRYGYVHLKKNMFSRENGRVNKISNVVSPTSIFELILRANL